MPRLQWILASALSLSGWRFELLLVRVTRFARVIFVGLAWAISPPAPRLAEVRETIDADFEVIPMDAVVEGAG